MKIAVIGTGISGLGAAWLLDQKYQVTVYEQNDYAGGHANTVAVPGDDGELGIDAGFIVYNERNYPHLSALFRHLGVATTATDMSFSASIDRGRVEYAGDNINTLFGQRRNIMNWRHWRMLAQILRFNRRATAMLDAPELEHLSLAEFLSQEGFHDELCERYLLPMGAAIWSCPPAQMREFPASAFLRFFHNHGLLSVNDRPAWRTVNGGSREYVRRLLGQLRGQVRIGCGVTGILRDDRGVTVRDVSGGSARFDHVVFATHADQALALLDAPGFWERTLLGAFRYQDNTAVLHTDTTLMPRRRRVWASWNYLSEQADGSDRSLSVTYWMNRLQSLDAVRPYLVSLNPLRAPQPERVLARFDYQHPVFDARAIRSQGLLEHLQGQRRTWFCGSYFGYGFHEDGLRSGIDVARRFGVRPPWAAAPADMPVPAAGRLPDEVPVPAMSAMVARQGV